MTNFVMIATVSLFTNPVPTELHHPSGKERIYITNVFERRIYTETNQGTVIRFTNDTLVSQQPHKFVAKTVWVEVPMVGTDLQPFPGFQQMPPNLQ